MLNLVKSQIVEAQSSPITFPQHYVQYICTVQDDNILNECRFLSNQSLLNINGLSTIIEAESQKGDELRHE